MNKKHIILYLSLILLSACQQKNKVNKDASADSTTAVNSLTKGDLVDSLTTQKEDLRVQSHKDDGEKWLKDIFKTKTSDKYFPSYNVEEKLCTKRFQKFIIASGELYGASNLTDAEFPIAEKKYKEKWSSIYPMEEKEMWLFGRGNGDMGELQQLKISKLNDSLYRVFVDYGDGFKTDNEVRLVMENGIYKIDYCKTTYLD